MKAMFSSAVTIFIVAVLLISVPGIFKSVYAQAPEIYLTPVANNFTTNTATIGTTFNVTVWVRDAPPISAWQLYLEFNDNILSVTQWIEPTTDPQYIFNGSTTVRCPTPPDPNYLSLGPGIGRVLVAASLFPTPPIQPPRSGNGILCILTFNVTALPPESGSLSSALAIDESDTYLLDPDFSEITPIIKTDGSYGITWVPLLPGIYMTPSVNSFTTNTATIGTTFDVTIWVKDIPKVGYAGSFGCGAWQVYLEFNDAILSVTRWVEPTSDPAYIFYGLTTSANPTPPDPSYLRLPPYPPNPPYPPYYTARVQVAASLFPTPPAQNPVYGAGPFKLCILTFSIRALPPDLGNRLSSAFAINSLDTYLLDSDGDTIEPITKTDGSYSITRVSPPNIYMTPSANDYTTNTATVGTMFDVTLWAENITQIESTLTPGYFGCSGWQAYLEFNDAILSVTRWVEPTSDPAYIFYGKNTFGNPTPPDPGYVHVSVGRGLVLVAANLFPTPPDQQGSWGTGPFKLCVLTFNITALPPKMDYLSCALAINKPDTFLLDCDGNDMTLLTKTDGSYKITWVEPLTRPFAAVNPPIVLVPPPYAGCTFMVELQIMNLDPLWQIVDANFTLTYDPTQIELSSVAVDPVWDRLFSFSVTRGVLNRIDINVSTTMTLGGNVSVTKFTFKALSIGKSRIAVVDCHMHDHVIEIPTDQPREALIIVGKCDLAVIDVAPDKNVTAQGYSMRINVTAQNQGNFIENSSVIVYYNQTSFGEQDVTNLAPGANITLIFTWNTSGFAMGNYTISAYVNPVLGETDTADNMFIDGLVTVAMAGDVNGDGKVDVKDIYTVAKAYASFGPDYFYPGSPPQRGWKPECDINGDNKVDLKDFYMTCKNYGKTSP